MNEWAFWNEWKTRHRVLYLLLGLFFLVSLAFFLYAWLRSPAEMMGWTTSGDIRALPVAVDAFSRDFFTFRIDVDAYLITEIFKPGERSLSLSAMDLMLAFWLVGLVFLLAAATYIRKIFWFAGAMIGGLSFLLAAQFTEMSAPLDSMQSQDPDQYFMMVSLLLVTGVSYIFHSILPRTSLLARVLAFGLIVGGIAYYFVFHYAGVSDPVFAVGNFMLIAPLTVSLLFITFNAHEIPHTLTYFITNSGEQRHNFRHFIIALVVYMLNLAYGFAVSIRATEPDILYLSPFFIYFLTTVLSIWGFRRRRDSLSHILNFDPFGAVLFLAVAIISNATIAYAFITNNNPLLEVFEDIILFSHIGMAISFLGYVFTNFGNQLQFNLPIYRIIWNPKRLDFIFFFGLGLLIMTIFGLRTDFFPRNQVWAGYYNGIADVFRREKLDFLAKKYHELSLGYDYQSHRANYELALLHQKENDKDKALFFFEQALLKTPLPQTYARLTDMHLSLNRYQDAVWALEEGVRKFPRNGELRNNLALLYQQGGEPEKALNLLEAATKLSLEPEIPRANRYALLSGREKLEPPAELPEQVKAPAVWSNALVEQIRRDEPLNLAFEPQLLPDSVLDTPELCYLYHYVLSQLDKPDSSQWAEKITSYMRVPENTPQLSFLRTAAAFRFYANGNVREAVQLMRYLHEQQGHQSSVYANVLGYWYFENEQYADAVRMFEAAMQRGHQTGQLERALALSELRDKSKARLTWQVWALQEGNPYQELAKDMLSVIDWDKNEVPPESWSENNHYRLLYYFADSLPNAVFDPVFERLNSTDLQVLALSKRLESRLAAGDTAAVSHRYAQLDQLLPTLKSSLTRKQQAQLKALYFLDQTETLDGLLGDFQPERSLRGWKALFRARLARSVQDSTTAGTNFQEAVRQLPFEQAAYAEAVQFYKEEQDITAAYKFALKAIEMLPERPEAQKLYALTALEAGFESYARAAVAKLERLLSPTAYAAFRQTYTELEAELEAATKAWESGQ